MIFIVGHHNSGKSTIATLLKKYGFLHVETGDIIREIHKEQDPEREFSEWISEMNVKESDFLNNAILKKVNANLEQIKKNPFLQDIVVTGNRQVEGIEFLCENVTEPNSNIVIYMETNTEELYNRQLQRNDRIIDALTFEKFINEYLAFDTEMGLEQIRTRADVIVDSSFGVDIIFREVASVLSKHGFTFAVTKEKNGESIENYNAIPLG